MFKKIENRLKPIDKELMENSGEPRWRLNARWERKNMVLEGLLKADSPHGLWELTEKGKKLPLAWPCKCLIPRGLHVVLVVPI